MECRKPTHEAEHLAEHEQEVKLREPSWLNSRALLCHLPLSFVAVAFKTIPPYPETSCASPLRSFSTVITVFRLGLRNHSNPLAHTHTHTHTLC